MLLMKEASALEGLRWNPATCSINRPIVYSASVPEIRLELHNPW